MGCTYEHFTYTCMIKDRYAVLSGNIIHLGCTLLDLVCVFFLNIVMGRAMAQAVSRRPLTTEARGSIPGQVHVRFVVDKVALGQVFLRVVGFPLSISLHWCSINCKTW
jgi:hypothetical protein